MTPTAPAAILPLDATVAAASVVCPIAGRRALVRVLDSLLGPARVPAGRVVVVAAAGILLDVEQAVAEAGPIGASVVGCDPTASRSRCLTVGLAHLDPEPDGAILVHDHRHPLASGAVTERVLAGLASGHAVVVPALAMTDTVKETDDEGAVLQTVDRQSLRTVQYPRGYRADVLRALLAPPDEDEFAAAVAAGHPIEMVPGDADAITAALPADTALLEAILGSRRG
ncbi:IspD/TarI family cytidylyltransferase [Mycolicibacterium sediminis]|uniref:2-C-methyl-D-erythritol 4-phosphate cytidylyltransferase n=1 Tax=Mycolicibacterium sediminis TaxID=1286180 RepID=A0A7I7QX79_9MYCO|nr:2-C-methyl-D-erythritol 4-phosphate cytidylyltransferase [Mycolicibacterium sediminis]BBY30912.1 hypothetical protein MSEDJ_50080 [Mycolicibacterium sediminis]